MPTGYTAAIADGKKEVTFKDFVMSCARAFGALIMMRDDPSDAPIPEEFTPSPFYADNLAKARRDHEKVFNWTLEEADAAAAADYRDEVSSWNERRIEREAQRQRYEAMLDQVAAWPVPSVDHQGLKDFMIQQLNESIKWDCTPSYDKTPHQMNGAAFKEARLASLARDIEYGTKSLREETERVAQRNRWIKQLRESL